MATFLETRLVSPHTRPPTGEGISELVGQSFLGTLAKKVGEMWEAHKAKKAEQHREKLRIEGRKEFITNELRTFIEKNHTRLRSEKPDDYEIYAQYSASKVSTKLKGKQWADARNSIMWEFPVKEREKMVQEAKRIVALGKKI